MKSDMVILNLKLENILAFNDFEVSFSYPKKLSTSLIEEENLNYRKSFRYKKLNVFVGSNSTGKTSLVKCIWKTLLFLTKGERNEIESLYRNGAEHSSIVIDFAEENIEKSSLYRVIIDHKSGELKIAHQIVGIKEGDSYESLRKVLDKKEYILKDYLEEIRGLNLYFGWNIVLPATEGGFDTVKFLHFDEETREKEYINILNDVLITLDPSIIEVKKSLDSENAIVIKSRNTGNIIIQEGNKLSYYEMLSSGTKYGISLANTIYSIKHHINGIYLVDEQFSYVDSEIEAAILALLVSLLGPNEQLFFTTHNHDILDSKLPFHSFYLMRKEIVGDNQKIYINCASEAGNKNNVSPKTVLDNDVFNTSPNLERIYSLFEKE